MLDTMRKKHPRKYSRWKDSRTRSCDYGTRTAREFDDNDNPDEYGCLRETPTGYPDNNAVFRLEKDYRP
jgi:hypothetical protein